ncbi:unnamed protein product [Diamesa tonsa]
MAHNLSTRERLLSIIDDIEIISKEIIENLLAPKHQKTSDHLQLVDLLIVKDNEMKQLMKLATDQEKIDQKINMLKTQVGKYDQEINQLQKQLKEAEQILSTAIFQAKQKLSSISKANDRPIHSEELIKFAYRISASHAISAPLTWQQGDLRRPYPTDIEMRLGFLGKSDQTVNGHALQAQSSVNDVNRNTTGGKFTKPGSRIIKENKIKTQFKHIFIYSSLEIPASAQNQFAWHPTGELHMMSMGSQSSVSLDTNRAHKDASQDDASTDSSSSSSSDSQ